VPEAVRLGPFAVCAERGRAAAFRRSIGGSGEGLPATFPICWLGRRDIRERIERACGGKVPLHEAQSFEYVQPLEFGRDYRLTLHLNEEAHPPRLVLKAEIATTAGDLCVKMETMLRLVAPAALELLA
jgi:hypothetical protein